MSRPPGRLPQHIHLVGIGGIGLSAIARVLALRGHLVSGSDLRSSAITKGLNELGIATAVGHAAENVTGAELVVISSAVPASNPEVQAAQTMGIPVIKRQQLLARLTADNLAIAVAGTHGKTTTAAMMAVVLDRLGLAPTFVVGGIIAGMGVNASAGDGPHFVIEADEYDRAFHGLRPHIAVVTNIEMDHPDCYRDLDDLRSAFGVFLEGVPAGGMIVAGADSPQVTRLLQETHLEGRHIVTYGLDPASDYCVRRRDAGEEGELGYEVVRKGEAWAPFSLTIPGHHNALNATAVLAVADLLRLDGQQVASALAHFRGTWRRFQLQGERGGVTVVDDYAHHPTQVRATLAAARERFPGRRLWVVFQPHTFSRTRALLSELAVCFNDADELLITDIYPARAHEKPTISAQEVVAVVQHPRVRYVPGIDAAVAHVWGGLRAGDVLLTMGAGDSYVVGERILALLAGERSS